MTGVEVEVSLAVVHPDPEALLERLRGLERLGGWSVRPGPERRLRDVYLDRDDAELQEAGLALRVRFPRDGDPVLGIKDAGRPLQGGGVARREREEGWGPEALTLLDRELAGAGLAHATPPPDPLLPPLEALRHAGFRIVQDRVTVRRPATLSAGADPVAELVVDEVRFRVEGREFAHAEVEVEAADDAPDPEELVAAAARALVERFGEGLRRWDHPKLATGLALQRLGREEVEGVTGEDGRLLPAAYDLIEALLSGAGEGGAPAGEAS